GDDGSVHEGPAGHPRRPCGEPGGRRPGSQPLLPVDRPRAGRARAARLGGGARPAPGARRAVGPEGRHPAHDDQRRPRRAHRRRTALRSGLGDRAGEARGGSAGPAAAAHPAL
ncbi:MAG: FIG01123413: hypothetical protein, partial [uncultured Blastococcus sp.]